MDEHPTITVGHRKPLALIMKGGGAKGLAYVGALEVLEEKYQFDWFVGTSAGAIAAVLLGAGYSVADLKSELMQKNLRDFFDATWKGAIWNLIAYRGAYQAQTFTDWIDRLLSSKLSRQIGGPRRVELSDLPHRVTVFASRTGKRFLKFDSVTANVAAAYAARCSMSIPFVFTPQSEQGVWTYDGGLQNNFPVEAVVNEHKGLDFIGLYLGSRTYQPPARRSVLCDLISIWMDATDNDVIQQHGDRIIVIDPSPIDTLDFRLRPVEKEYLLAAGRVGALEHLAPNSTRHLEEKKEYERLRTEVIAQRAARRAARAEKWRRRKVGIGIATLVAIIGFASWLNWPPPMYDGSFEDYLQAKKNANADADAAEFIDKHDENRVDWMCRVAGVSEARKYYLIQPLSATTNERIAVYPSSFEQSIDRTKSWRIHAQIDHIGPDQTILKNAKFD